MHACMQESKASKPASQRASKQASWLEVTLNDILTNHTSNLVQHALSRFSPDDPQSEQLTLNICDQLHFKNGQLVCWL